VGTLGLMLVVMVTSASVQDRPGGRTILERLAVRFPSVGQCGADGGYAYKIDDIRGFRVLPRRRVVERALGRRTSQLGQPQHVIIRLPNSLLGQVSDQSCSHP
jgi:hypothetical protein